MARSISWRMTVDATGQHRRGESPRPCSTGSTEGR